MSLFKKMCYTIVEGSACMKKKIVYILLFIISFFIILTIVFFPRLKLKNQNMKLEVNSEYKEPGYKAYNLFKGYSKKVKVSSKLNNKKIGKYKIKYSYKYLFIKKTKTRNVEVVDTKKPVIKLEYDDEEICRNKYKEYSYKATDNYDGDLTDKVKVTIKAESIIYTVEDSSKNKTIKIKKIKFKTDNEPSIELKGKEKIYLYKGYNYKEPGYEAKDDCDGDLTDKVKVEGSVDKDNLGTYEITYSVMNSNEKKREIKRVIEVIDRPYNQEANDGSGKTVFLTFDDGPGSNTRSILNTLNKYDVKATFFVTNQFPGYQSLIKEEFNAGHVVAVHTLSHNYNIYTSVETYIDDFNRMNDIIEAQTGTRSKLFRFPGGSSNSVSKKYSEGVITSIAGEMTNLGYVYFDWNVSSGDAAGASDVGIYNNVIKGVSKCGSTCVVLMHDIKYNTAKALDPILSELKSKNYKFGVLSESGPIVHHKIIN